MLLTTNPEMLAADTMYDHFVANILKQKLFEPHHRILLAVSGGMDSMAMLELFRKSPFSFAIAHCNFKIRGKEANKDQQFVKGVARKMQTPFYTVSFETAAYARKQKLSIQMAARELRYSWFEEIRKKDGFDRIATAHHLDDSIETLLLNLCRGTGIDGLTGIPAISGHVVRPLLYASRKNIEAYIADHNLNYREDASNAEEKYHRNAIRHQLIPALEAINPSLQSTMKAFFDKMQAKAGIYHQAIKQSRKKICIRNEDNGLRIIKAKLLSLDNYEVFLYEFLKEFGFSPAICNDISNNLTRQPGKMFHSDTHSLLIDRKELLVFPAIRENTCHKLSAFQSTEKLQFGNYTLTFTRIDLDEEVMPQINTEQNTVWLDLDKLQFPLTIRTWKHGDKIRPLGMSGSKKLSDLFIEHKIPVNKKKNIPVIISGGVMVWVAGVRSSETHRVADITKKILRIVCQPHPLKFI